jgi:hypothetical protein
VAFGINISKTVSVNAAAGLAATVTVSNAGKQVTGTPWAVVLRLSLYIWCVLLFSLLAEVVSQVTISSLTLFNTPALSNFWLWDKKQSYNSSNIILRYIGSRYV